MFSTVVICILVILIVLIYIIYLNNTHLNNIPKPPSHILMGHLLDFKDTTKTLEILTNYTIKYGGLLRIYIPPVKPSVLITDPQVLDIILTSNQTLSKSKDYRFGKPWLGTGLLTSEVKKWKGRRRMLTPCFGRLSLLKHFIDVFDSLGNILIDKLNKEINNNDLDIFPLIKMYSLDVICETSMGVSINAQRYGNRHYVKSIEQMCEVALNRSRTPYKRFDFIHRFTKDYKKQTEAVEIIDSFFYDIIKNRKTNNVPVNTKTNDEDKLKLAFLDLLLKLNKEDNKFALRDVREEVNSFLFGGHDTTATGIAFTLYVLARHPKVQEKVIEEQLNILGTLNKMSPSYNDLQNMKYLELVIYETLRIFPPIPAIGRKITTDIDLGNGVILPKNLNICIFIYGCHHNPKYFADPEKFIPERFEGNKVKPFTFLPFSSGPRNCIGQKYAILQMKSCISQIVKNFKLQPSNPEYNLELSPRLTLVSNNGIRLSLQKRMFD